METDEGAERPAAKSESSSSSSSTTASASSLTDRAVEGRNGRSETAEDLPLPVAADRPRKTTTPPKAFVIGVGSGGTPTASRLRFAPILPRPEGGGVEGGPRDSDENEAAASSAAAAAGGEAAGGPAGNSAADERALSLAILCSTPFARTVRLRRNPATGSYGLDVFERTDGRSGAKSVVVRGVDADPPLPALLPVGSAIMSVDGVDVRGFGLTTVAREIQKCRAGPLTLLVWLPGGPAPPWESTIPPAEAGGVGPKRGRKRGPYRKKTPEERRRIRERNRRLKMLERKLEEEERAEAAAAAATTAGGRRDDGSAEESRKDAARDDAGAGNDEPPRPRRWKRGKSASREICDRCRSGRKKCDGRRPCGRCVARYRRAHKLKTVDGVDAALLGCTHRYVPPRERGSPPGKSEDERSSRGGIGGRKEEPANVGVGVGVGGETVPPIGGGACSHRGAAARSESSPAATRAKATSKRAAAEPPGGRGGPSKATKALSPIGNGGARGGDGDAARSESAPAAAAATGAETTTSKKRAAAEEPPGGRGGLVKAKKARSKAEAAGTRVYPSKVRPVKKKNARSKAEAAGTRVYPSKVGRGKEAMDTRVYPLEERVVPGEGAASATTEAEDERPPAPAPNGENLLLRRADYIVRDGDGTVILDEFDSTQVTVVYDVPARDPRWHRSYRTLLALRNHHLLKPNSVGYGGWINPDPLFLPGLRRWADEQRALHAGRHGALRGKGADSEEAQSTLAKIKLLNSVHFVWCKSEGELVLSLEHMRGGASASAGDVEWRGYCLRLAREYVFRRGHAHVPNFTELGAWCCLQRWKRRRSALRWDKVLALSSLGFDWSAEGEELADWSAMLLRLERHNQTYGDCLVAAPPDVDDPDPNGGRDGKFLLKFGGGRVTGEADDEKVGEGARSEGRGTDDEAPAEAEDALRAPVEGEGDGRGDALLWWWVQHQRAERHSYRRDLPVLTEHTRVTPDTWLTPERIARLDRFGFAWHRTSSRWILSYREFKAHSVTEEGRVDMKRLELLDDAKKRRELFLFANLLRGKSRQMKRRAERERVRRSAETRDAKRPAGDSPPRDWREFYHKSSFLTPELIRLLDGIGFPWELEGRNFTAEANAEHWDRKFRELCEYKERSGNTLVHQQHPSLGPWVKVLRKAYSLRERGVKGPGSYGLTEERIRKLNSVGFVWRIRGRRGEGPRKEEALKGAREAWKEARKKRREEGEILGPTNLVIDNN